MTTKYYRTPAKEVYTSRESDDEIRGGGGGHCQIKSVTKMQIDYMHYKPIPNDDKADVLSVIEVE